MYAVFAAAISLAKSTNMVFVLEISAIFPDTALILIYVVRQNDVSASMAFQARQR